MVALLRAGTALSVSRDGTISNDGFKRAAVFAFISVMIPFVYI